NTHDGPSTTISVFRKRLAVDEAPEVVEGAHLPSLRYPIGPVLLGLLHAEEVHKPRFENRCGGLFQQLSQPPIALDLVIECSEDGGDASLLLDIRKADSDTGDGALRKKWL